MNSLVPDYSISLTSDVSVQRPTSALLPCRADTEAVKTEIETGSCNMLEKE